jgi:hypothetical protein
MSDGTPPVRPGHWAAAAGFSIGMGKLAFPPDLSDIKALGDRFGIEMVLPKA